MLQHAAPFEAMVSKTRQGIFKECSSDVCAFSFFTSGAGAGESSVTRTYGLDIRLDLRVEDLKEGILRVSATVVVVGGHQILHSQIESQVVEKNRFSGCCQPSKAVPCLLPSPCFQQSPPQEDLMAIRLSVLGEESPSRRMLFPREGPHLAFVYVNP